jgi:Fe-S cluster assembly ATP-binding protein
MPLLVIKDLHANVGDKPILKGLSLTVDTGSVHAVMGPNGSGKSTLAQVLAGNPAYEVTGGSIEYDGRDLLEMQPEERAQAGMFLAFQYPSKSPGCRTRTSCARRTMKSGRREGTRKSIRSSSRT